MKAKCAAKLFDGLHVEVRECGEEMQQMGKRSERPGERVSAPPKFDRETEKIRMSPADDQTEKNECCC